MTGARWSWDESEVTGGKVRGSACVLTQQMWSWPSGKTSYLEKYISERKSTKTNKPPLLTDSSENSNIRLKKSE